MTHYWKLLLCTLLLHHNSKQISFLSRKYSKRGVVSSNYTKSPNLVRVHLNLQASTRNIDKRARYLRVAIIFRFETRWPECSTWNRKHKRRSKRRKPLSLSLSLSLSLFLSRIFQPRIPWYRSSWNTRQSCETAMVPGAWPPAANAEPPSKFAARFARQTKRYQQRSAEAGEQPIARHNTAISGRVERSSALLPGERKRMKSFVIIGKYVRCSMFKGSGHSVKFSKRSNFFLVLL